MIPGQLNFWKGLRSNTDLLSSQKQKRRFRCVHTMTKCIKGVIVTISACFYFYEIILLASFEVV